MANFDRAFKILHGLEGGYVNSPEDNGGETKYGISKRSYPNEDIPNLTIERAMFLAKRDFWDRYGLDDVPWELAWTFFEAAFVSGPTQATRWMQRAMYLKVDGIFGPITREAMRKAADSDVDEIVYRFLSERVVTSTLFEDWNVYKRGWSYRYAKSLGIAIKGDV